MLLIAAFLLIQFGLRDDVIELRQYLGRSYATVLQALDNKNQILLRNTRPLAPAQAAEMAARMKSSNALPAGRPILPVRIDNAGQGLVTFLFEDDFLTEQVNFVFCPAVTAQPERVIAIQVLFDDRRALQSAPTLLGSIYRLGQPTPLTPQYQLALTYPVRSDLPLTLWNLGSVEAIYQTVPGQQLVTGQLWLTDKQGVAVCAAVPKL